MRCGRTGLIAGVAAVVGDEGVGTSCKSRSDIASVAGVVHVESARVSVNGRAICGQRDGARGACESIYDVAGGRRRTGLTGDCVFIRDIHTNNVARSVRKRGGVSACFMAGRVESGNHDKSLAGLGCDGYLNRRGIAGCVGAIARIVGVNHIGSTGKILCFCGSDSAVDEREFINALRRVAGKGCDERNVACWNAGPRIGFNRDTNRDVLGLAVWDSGSWRKGQSGCCGNRIGSAPGCGEIVDIERAETGDHVVAGADSPCFGSCMAGVNEDAVR